MDALRVGVLLYDSEGGLEFFSARAQALTGFTPQELLGTPFSPFADAEEFREVWQRASQGHTWEGPVSIRTRGGLPRFLECWVSPIPDSHSILFILRDAGGEVPGGTLERETLRMDAVGAYIRGIDREVVNILTLGMAAAELLHWRISPEDPLVPCVENLLQACRRGVELNRQASHIALGSNATARPIDLTACIRTSLDLVAASLPITIHLQSALSSGIWITASPGTIHSLISSLAHTTTQILGADGGSLGITLSETLDGVERTALITLQGKPSAGSLSGPIPGLAVAQAMAQAHRGSLSWTAEPEAFTCTLRLPCASVTYAPPPKEGSSLQLKGKERLGLVEPDAMLATALKDGLEALGYAVTVCHTARNAMEAIWTPAGEQDLWITEHHLPDAPEPTWLDRLASQSKCPVLIIGEQGTLACGVLHPNLPKPFSVSDLARSVRHILGSHPAQRELDSPCSEPIPPETGARPRTILVVEDSRVFRNFLHSTLQQAGYLVLEAQDGAVALETFIQASMSHPVDLVLTDIVMPRMDGLELIRQIRRLDHQIPIAVLTSMEDQQTAKKALQLGVNGFMNKPFNKENLLECVGGMIQSLDDTRRAEDTAREVRLAHSTLLAVQEKDLPIYSIYEPLSDAGGDIFRCFRLPAGEILFILADIAGHSVVSSYAVASLLGILSTFVTQFRGLKPLALGLNQAIQNGPFPDIPACALLGHWSPRTGRLHLLNAGLPHGLVFQREQESTHTISINGPPLGILPEPLVEERVLQLQPGDRVLFASDGFFDACSPDGRSFYTLVSETWSGLGGEPIQGALNRVCESVRNHGKRVLSDDLLVVGFEQAPLDLQQDEFLVLMPSTPRDIDRICIRLKDYMATRQGPMQFSPSKRFEIILAAREALTNAMIHGNGSRRDQRICLHAWLGAEGRRFQVRVLDEGQGFDLEHYEAALDPSSERGRGIPIMRHYCSRLSMVGGELNMEFEMEDPRDASS